jgi:hypothetical protein
MENDIEALFRTRDEAVRKQDRSLFLSSQVSEIEFGSSDGYLSLEDITTEVISIHDESEIEKVVLVKETFYRQPDENPRSSFLVYFLTNTVEGWRIYSVR